VASVKSLVGEVIYVALVAVAAVLATDRLALEAAWREGTAAALGAVVALARQYLARRLLGA
jgi:uncharacterized membrane protein